MKKILLLIVLLIPTLLSTSQINVNKMSNYEKYLLDKENTLSSDTIYKTDTVYVISEQPEYDDLYFTTKKTELKLKQKELQLERKKLRILQDSLYYDAKKEVYEDLYYTSLIYRFHSPFSFSYYSPYWRFHYGWYDPFWGDPWYYDSWYFGWGYPYHNWYYPRYYDHWRYPYRYYWYDWRYKPYYVNNYYSINSTDIKSVPYGRRDRQSTLGTFKSAPVIINRTVEINRRDGRVLNVQTQEQKRSISSATLKTNTTIQNENRRISTVVDRKSNNSAIKINPSDKPIYVPTERRNYTPAYIEHRSNTKPQYNNTIINRRYESNSSRYNYRLPIEHRSSTTSPTQSRTYSTPRRSSSYSPSRQNSGSYGNTYRSGSSGNSSSGTSGTRRR